MPTTTTLLRFVDRIDDVRKPRAVKATLRPDVERSVSRSINLLPALGSANPDAALLIGEYIDDWMGPAPPDEDQPAPVPRLVQERMGDRRQDDRRRPDRHRMAGRIAAAAFALALGVVPDDWIDDAPVHHRVCA